MRGEKQLREMDGQPVWGSPPHARGKVHQICSHYMKTGITPACAGKRAPLWWCASAPRDHPRMRGEKNAAYADLFEVMGSPPHAREKDFRRTENPCPHRITPACAGKSSLLRTNRSRGRDHPRMRGEKPCRAVFSFSIKGSPPHARGKVRQIRSTLRVTGITPACAGKRTHQHILYPQHRDHPRMRGEKLYGGAGSGKSVGSPPHARGKEQAEARQTELAGITPACAGKSRNQQSQKRPRQDHPRMRGEKGALITKSPIVVGSPPHARGKVPFGRVGDNALGITPACAGKSCPNRCNHPLRRDHPRMRGEKESGLLMKCSTSGSPPHARGKVKPLRLQRRLAGITPACAGKSDRRHDSAK